MKILLCCCAGMSTSLLVDRMKSVARGRNLDVHIDAIPVDEFYDVVKEYDLVLLGPQVRYKKDEFEEAAKEHGIPLDIIDSMDYGMVKADKILDTALKLIK